VKVIEGYTLGQLLGHGAFAKVRLATRNSEKVAMKVASKSFLRKMKENYRDEQGVLRQRSALQKVYVEIDVLAKASHPRIPKLYDVFEDDFDDKIYLVLQLAEKNALVDWSDEDQSFHITRQGLTELSEARISSIASQCLEALEYRTQS
jgi:serine/threonine protein kinase